ncbi:GNAT family N-acetyltransferase [Oligoflexia bacterium]|nr:GNAT family N-acetyltransferase [Oligoflexia bacterium]
MNIANIEYKTKAATDEEIFLHLKECNHHFNPPLEDKVNISEYSKKISEKAVTFEAWTDQTLKGLVAAYFNDFKNMFGYITNVSLAKDCIGKGVATQLMRMCITYARRWDFKEISLEVFQNNIEAIRLYKKFGFINIEDKSGLILMKCNLVEKKCKTT